MWSRHDVYFLLSPGHYDWQLSNVTSRLEKYESAFLLKLVISQVPINKTILTRRL